MEIERYLLVMIKQELESFSNTDDILVKRAIFNRIIRFIGDIDRIVFNV